MSSPNCDNIHPSDEVKYKGYTCTVVARHCDKNTVDLELCDKGTDSPPKKMKGVSVKKLRSIHSKSSSKSRGGKRKTRRSRKSKKSFWLW